MTRDPAARSWNETQERKITKKNISDSLIEKFLIKKFRKKIRRESSSNPDFRPHCASEWRPNGDCFLYFFLLSSNLPHLNHWIFHIFFIWKWKQIKDIPLAKYFKHNSVIKTRLIAISLDRNQPRLQLAISFCFDSKNYRKIESPKRKLNRKIKYEIQFFLLLHFS